MNIETRDEAIRAAQKFIKLAKEITILSNGPHKWLETGKDSGAAKRASMDLTRALAIMRRPG